MSSAIQRKTVLITGCSEGGIGHALATEYLSEGLRVFATARTGASIDSLKELGAECLELDVRSLESIQEVREIVSAKTGGKLDILVNNAGISHDEPAIEADLAAVRTMFDTNFFGVFMMVQEFARMLIESEDGRIVNIGSIAGIIPYAYGAAYGATKAALHAYGHALSIELAPFNVKVITIITGGVQSNFAAPQKLRELKPDSLYLPVKEGFDKTRWARTQEGGLPREEYARTVVAASLEAKPRAWVWRGANSTKIWLMGSIVPSVAMDGVISRMVGLDKLKGLLKKTTAVGV